MSNQDQALIADGKQLDPWAVQGSTSRCQNIENLSHSGLVLEIRDDMEVLDRSEASLSRLEQSDSASGSDFFEVFGSRSSSCCS